MLSRYRKWVFSVILLHPAEVATASTGGGGAENGKDPKTFFLDLYF